MIGTVLRSRYELTHLLGESPIFAAYAARDRLVGRDACVRLFKPPFSGERDFISKVGEVAQRAGSVANPALERLYDVEEEDGSVFLVSELSRGSSLADRIRKLAPYSVPVSVSMAASVLEGLEALHAEGYVHGDVGSHNVVMTPDGTARLQLPGLWEAFSASTTAGAIMLPLMAPFLAPEVSAGAAPSAASDVYGAAVILFQLLTGRAPYTAESAVGMAMKHATAPTPSARSLNPSVPAALDEALKKAMAKEPAQRYANASAMLRDLRAIEEAARFGRNVAWSPGKGASPKVPQEPIAPKMSALREKPAKPPREEVEYREPREPRDVPVWMLVVSFSTVAVTVALVALWAMFNLNAPRLVKVPNVKGRPMAEARETLERFRLQMRVLGRESSERVPADSVLDINPEPGQQVREGGIVTVRLSAGSRYVSVPDLRGRTLDEARSLLGSLNLELDDQVLERQDRNIERGKIVAQRPEPRMKVERFTKISVTVSSGSERPRERTEPPQRFLYTLRIRLTGITEPVLLRVDMTDEAGNKTIYEETHLPNDEVSVRQEGLGEKALFRIFYDGEMVEQVEKRPGEPEEQAAASPQEDAE